MACQEQRARRKTAVERQGVTLNVRVFLFKMIELKHVGAHSDSDPASQSSAVNRAVGGVSRTGRENNMNIIPTLLQMLRLSRKCVISIC